MHYYDRIRTGWLSGRIMGLSGISCHGAGSPVCQWEITIVHTMRVHCDKLVPVLI